MRLAVTELPVYMDRETGNLTFQEGLVCGGYGEKCVGDMMRLFHDTGNVPEKEIVYKVYRDICFPGQRQIFLDRDIRYDITVVYPGDINGEFKKTSGHYHGYKADTDYTYPEVYQVIKGRMLFVFQRLEGECVGEVKAVSVKEGESVIIPPFYGHCAVNPTDDYAAFCNLAVVSCPIDYGPVQKNGGLSVRVFRGKEGYIFKKNLSYGAIPEVKTVVPVSCEEYGNVPGLSCYKSFIQNPEKYRFLSEPENYAAKINQLLREV